MTTFVDPKDPNAATLAAQNAKAADVASVRLAAEKAAAYREAAANQKASDITKTEADRVAKLKSEAATAAQAAANAGFIPAPVFNGPFPAGNPGSNGQFYSGNPNFPVSVGPNASASSRVVQVSSATNASGTPPLPSYGFHAINPATSAGANPPNPTSAGSVPPHTYPDPTETVVVSNQPLVNQYPLNPTPAGSTAPNTYPNPSANLNINPAIATAVAKGATFTGVDGVIYRSDDPGYDAALATFNTSRTK